MDDQKDTRAWRKHPTREGEWRTALRLALIRRLQRTNGGGRAAITRDVPGAAEAGFRRMCGGAAPGRPAGRG